MNLLIDVLGLEVNPELEYTGSTIYNPALNSFVFDGDVLKGKIWVHDWVTINVHEFAFKCKEWAYDTYGAVLVSGRSVEDSYRYFCSIRVKSEFFYNSLADNEVDAIMDCCFYLREVIK